MPDEIVEHSGDMVAQRVYMLRQIGMDWLDIQTSLVAESYVATAPSIDALRQMLRQYTVAMASYIGASDREMILGMELARLDRLQSALWNNAMNGDSKSIDTILRIMVHRAKLTGLDQLSTEDKKTLNTVLIVGGNQAAFLEALEHGRGQLMAGQLPDDEDVLEGEVIP